MKMVYFMLFLRIIRTNSFKLNLKLSLLIKKFQYQFNLLKKPKRSLLLLYLPTKETATQFSTLKSSSKTYYKRMIKSPFHSLISDIHSSKKTTLTTCFQLLWGARRDCLSLLGNKGICIIGKIKKCLDMNCGCIL